LQQFASGHKVPETIIAKSALSRLQRYAWPGNVRELRNLCERLTIMLAGQVVEEAHLPPEIPYCGKIDSTGIQLPESGIELEKVEIDLINQALQRTQGNRTRSAKLLGISRDTLLYRMQKHGIT